jgi:hypothetical protein
MIPNDYLERTKKEKLNYQGGSWDSESDYEEWTYKGLLCLAVRHSTLLHWCAYVGVPKSNPLHGIQYSDRIESLRAMWEKRKEQPIGEHPSMAVMLQLLCGEHFNDPTMDKIVDVHGGITFASPHFASSDPSLWFFGFDCGHCNDVSPYMQKYEHMRGSSYRTIQYVKQQTEHMADQIIAITDVLSNQTKE